MEGSGWKECLVSVKSPYLVIEFKTNWNFIPEEFNINYDVWVEVGNENK